MNKTRATLAAAVAAAMGLGVAGEAAASAYAGAQLLFDEFRITSFNQSGQIPTGADIGSFLITNRAGATLNGVNVPGGAPADASCGGTFLANDCTDGPPRLQVTANAPGGAPIRAAGDYSFLSGTTPLNNDQFSNSASETTTAQLAGDPKTEGKLVSEGQVSAAGTHTASSSSSFGSTTQIVWTFDVGEFPVTTVIDFLADPSLYAAVAADPTSFVDANAFGSISASLSLQQDTDLGIGNGGNGELEGVTWAPQGSAVDNCVVTEVVVGTVICTEDADGEDLNLTVGAAANMSDNGYSDDRYSQFAATTSPDMGLSAFGITIDGLDAGSWTLTLASTTGISVRETLKVPVPGTLLLLGAGMIGGGFVRARKRRAG